MSTDIRFNKKKVNHFQGTTSTEEMEISSEEWDQTSEEFFRSSVKNEISPPREFCIGGTVTRDRFDALVAYQPSRFISMRYGCP